MIKFILTQQNIMYQLRIEMSVVNSIDKFGWIQLAHLLMIVCERQVPVKILKWCVQIMPLSSYIFIFVKSQIQFNQPHQAYLCTWKYQITSKHLSFYIRTQHPVLQMTLQMHMFYKSKLVKNQHAYWALLLSINEMRN